MNIDYYRLSRDELYILNPSQQDLLPIVKDILAYCETQTGLSYNELNAYIYDNDKYLWDFTLRKPHIRRYIAKYLRDKRKKEGIRYKYTLDESKKQVSKAKEKYLERQANGTMKLTPKENNLLKMLNPTMPNPPIEEIIHDTRALNILSRRYYNGTYEDIKSLTVEDLLRFNGMGVVSATKAFNQIQIFKKTLEEYNNNICN